MILDTRQKRKNFVSERAQFSNCNRHKVCAVITDIYGEIVSWGINRAPGTLDQCNEKNCTIEKPCENTLHAEIEALLLSDNRLCNDILTVNLFPCKICAKAIIASGVKVVEYITEYRDMSALELFKQAGIEVRNI